MDLSLIVILYIANIVIWIVILVKFNKIFSTDDILNKTRNELNSMLKNINSNAENNIDLIQKNIRDLKAISNEAEKRIKVLNFELDKAEKKRVFVQGYDSFTPEKKAPHVKQNVNVDVYQKEQIQGNLFSVESELTSKDGDSIEVYDNKSDVAEVIEVNQTPEENATVMSVPQVTVSENLITPKKTYKQQIKELSALGMTVEEIATEVGRSAQEVSVIIEFMNK